MQRVTRSIFFLLGLGATSPLLALVVGGRVISLMTIALLLCFYILIFNRYTRKFSVPKGINQYFMGWMLISIISSIFGFFYFLDIDPLYSITTIGFVPKILLYLFFYILLMKDLKGNLKSKWILEGIKVGIMLNILWSIVDACMYYSIRQSLTNLVFKAYIVATDMRFGCASIVDGFTIRSVGLNNDPATIGFFSIAGTAYSILRNKIWWIFICIFSAISCVSFVGLLGIILVIGYYLLFPNKKVVSTHKLTKVVCSIFVVIIGLSVYLYTSSNPLVNQLKTVVELRAESKMDGDHSSNTRKLFINKFPNALTHLPTSLFIGTGYYTGVYAYYKEGVSYRDVEIPTEMENTYVDNFFSFGLIGFVLFVLFYIKLFLYTRNFLILKKIDSLEIINSVSLASLIAFMGYHYTLYSVIMFVSISGLSQLSCRKFGYNLSIQSKDI